MATEDTSVQLPRIVIVGGGAGGLELATRLGHSLGRSRRAVITLLDDAPTHIWKPRLHEVAAGLLHAADDELSYAGQAYANSFQFMLGAMSGLDPERREVTLAPVLEPGTGLEILGERRFGYDYLVLAVGSKVNDFNTPGVAEYCFMLDDTAQANRLHQKFLSRALQVQMGKADCLRVAIVGAGATGVELAAELHHSVFTLFEYGGMLSPDELELTIVDLADRVLPAADPDMSEYAMDELERRNIRAVLGKRVLAVTEDALHLSDGEIITADVKIWASGVKGHDFLSACPGLQLTPGNQIKVDETLKCVGADRIFAMGDCAQFINPQTKAPLPPTAQAAHQQASLLAKSLPRVIKGEPALPFRFHYRGTLVSLGKHQAVGDLPSFRGPQKTGLQLRGFIAKFLYVSLYRMHLAALYGWPRMVALVVAQWLRGSTRPPVKLH
jgi:NADH dehydrogenase